MRAFVRQRATCKQQYHHCSTMLRKKAIFKNSLRNNNGEPVTSWRQWKQKKKEERSERTEKMLVHQIKLEASEKSQIQQTKQKESDKSQVHQIKQEKSNMSQLSNHNKTSAIDNGKTYTISIAIPGSILDNAQTAALKSYLAGQIARAAAVFNVNEIVVFNDNPQAFDSIEEDDESTKSPCCVQMVRILQYLECPQYLRKNYFPLHKDLEFAGVLNPLDIPHHLRMEDECEYREGTVLDKPVKDGEGSSVYIGLRKNAIIDKILAPGIRVTVKLDQVQNTNKHYKGVAVSPTIPYKRNGIYWGYNVRFAKNLNSVLSESPFKGGYDLTIGTSDKGKNVDSCVFPSFKHLLIVFGGLKGLQACLKVGESVSDEKISQLFHHYINVCPHQGSRTIRTEEAVLITMSALRPKLFRLQQEL